jgi:hypothetical protein
MRPQRSEEEVLLDAAAEAGWHKLAETPLEERRAAYQREQRELRARQEAEQEQEQQRGWEAFWQSLDARIRDSIGAQSEEQREALAQALDEMRDEVRTFVERAVERAVGAFEQKLADLEARLRSTASPLPQVKAWEPDTAAKRGELFTHKAATWQARRDTGQPPGGTHWVCVSRAGQDGTDGKSFTVRGTYQAGETYKILDVVIRNGGSFVALCDDPGPCPNDNWQMIAMPGKRGPQGERGAQGPRGLPAGQPTITDWSVDLDGDGYVVRPVLSNGEIGAALDLRPFFERYDAEVRA